MDTRTSMKVRHIRDSEPVLIGLNSEEFKTLIDVLYEEIGGTSSNPIFDDATATYRPTLVCPDGDVFLEGLRGVEWDDISPKLAIVYSGDVSDGRHGVFRAKAVFLHLCQRVGEFAEFLNTYEVEGVDGYTIKSELRFVLRRG